MKREILDYLNDILGAMSEAQKFTEGITFEDFMKDRKTHLAIEREIEIIGEAARNISSEIQRTYPQIPWADIIGMRNRLAHEYFGVKLTIMWDTVKKNIPTDKVQFEKVKQDAEKEYRERNQRAEHPEQDIEHKGRHR